MQAEVIDSVSPELDQAALRAIFDFVFEPAQRDGVPIAAKIRYAVPFRLPRPAVVEATTPEPSPTLSESAPEPEAKPKDAEVVVRGLSTADQMRQSAEAVQVIETGRARRETADLGQVIARSQGVVVRRSGGLGSEARFVLNGLGEDQIRYFVDGVPLEQAGYTLGVANVPVNLIERVEIYKGVVPIRFGADALGGAVNLVTRTARRGAHGFASYEFGSFGTYRIAVGAQSRHEPSGVFVRGDGFHDYARNDYPVDVEVTDPENGRLVPRTVRRFHDEYRATGGGIEAGVLGRPWAKRLSLRLFATDFDRDVQHNRTMTRVFGAVTEGQTRTGATLRYENTWDDTAFEGLATYSRGALEFLDTSRCAYDWYGNCQTERANGGELDGRPYDRRLIESVWSGRLLASQRIHPSHGLKLAVSPSIVNRQGQERELLPGATRDPFSVNNLLGSVVTGLEHEWSLFEETLSNVLFVKDYFQVQEAVEPLPNGNEAERDAKLHRLGWGDGLRYRFTEAWYAKASYELTTRLPKANEVFGDASLVEPNFMLEPETSHNVNLSVAASSLPTSLGTFRMETGGYLRNVENQILLLQGTTTAQFENVANARIMGVEGAAGWTSPRERLSLDANVTAQDARNTSTDGPFRAFEGDRLPNLPYLFGNGAASYRLTDVALTGDELSVTWNARYVHEFYLSWERFGTRSSKSVVESQLLHSLGLTYLMRRGDLSLSSTIEVQNVTDVDARDFYGVQKPGRAYFFKSVAEM